ncbi:unnamed protein product, partial [Meganyctiphanes norvegica]
SQPIRLAINTNKELAGKHMSPGNDGMSLTPILAVLLGVISSVLLMVLVITVVVRTRRPQPHRTDVKMAYEKAASSPPQTHNDHSSEERDPDIIPFSDEHQLKDFCGDSSTETLPMVDLMHLQQTSMYGHHLQQQLNSELHHEFQQQQHQQQHQHHVKDYLQHQDENSSFYIHPGTLLNKKADAAPPQETDPLLLSGHQHPLPLASSTPIPTSTNSPGNNPSSTCYTAYPSPAPTFSSTGAHPTSIYTSYNTLNSTGNNSNPLANMYNSYNTIGSSSTKNSPFDYQQNTMSLARNGSLISSSGGRDTPSSTTTSSSSSSTQHGSTSTVVMQPDSQMSRGPPLVLPLDRNSLNTSNNQ